MDAFDHAAACVVDEQSVAGSTTVRIRGRPRSCCCSCGWSLERVTDFSLCAVVSLASRHLVPHGDWFCTDQHSPTSRCLQPHYEWYTCNDIAGTCSSTHCNGVTGTCIAGARRINRSANWSMIRSAARSLAVPRPFLRGIPLSDLVLECRLALFCTRGTPVSGTLSSTVLFQQAACESCFVKFVVTPTPLSHRSNRSVPWPDKHADDLFRGGPPF